MSTCALCEPGEYQPEANATSCLTFYGVDASLISVEATVVDGRRRQLSTLPQLLLLRVVIAPAEGAGSTALSDLTATVGAANLTALSVELSLIHI